MFINFTPTNFQHKKTLSNTKNQNINYPNLTPITHDTVSFGAMKKSEFEGTDLAVVQKFKAPIEKFNSNEDLQNWAGDKAKAIANKSFGGRKQETEIQRQAMLKEWADYVLNENDAYTNTIALLILNAVTKDLKPDNDNLPPVLNKGVLADCIDEIDKSTKNDPKYQFDLNKMYQNKLREFYMNDIETNTGETGTKWVVIPSKEHDPDNFEANVEKLKTLSHHSWCTKSLNAEPYLADGDFHVYLENGNPKLGIRFLSDAILEIQGEKNNNEIPLAYFNEFEKYTNDNKFGLGDNAIQEVASAKDRQEMINITKSVLKNAIKNNDAKTIYEHFGIDVKEDKDGYLTISSYHQPYLCSFEDLGIDEKKLFEKVKSIEDIANFKNSKMTDLGNLESIGRDASFTNSKITNLGNLESIGGNANFFRSKVTDLGALKSIGGDANLDLSKVTDLGALKSIGGDASFTNSEITNLGNLESIGGDAYFNLSKVTNLGNLKTIGGDLYIDHSPLTVDDFKDIQIGGNLHT